MIMTPPAENSDPVAIWSLEMQMMPVTLFIFSRDSCHVISNASPLYI